MMLKARESGLFLLGNNFFLADCTTNNQVIILQNFVVSFRKFNGLGMPDFVFLID